MRPRFPVLVLLVLPFLVTAAPSCGSGEDSSRATAEAAPVAAYWDTDIDTGLVADEDGNRMVVKESRVVWMPAEGDSLVLLLDEQGRPAELLGEDFTALFDNYGGNQVDVMLLLPDGTTALAQGVEFPQPGGSEAAGEGTDTSASALTGTQASGDLGIARSALEWSFRKVLKEAAANMSLAVCGASIAAAVLTEGAAAPLAIQTCKSAALDFIIKYLGNPESKLAKNLVDLFQCGRVVNLSPITSVDAIASCLSLTVEQANELLQRCSRFRTSEGDLDPQFEEAAETLSNAPPPVRPRPLQHQTRACFRATPPGGEAPLHVFFDASCSWTTDPNGIRDYNWEMTRQDEKDRAPVVIGSGRFANAQLNENMSYTVILVARSVSGAKDEFSQTFTLDQKIPEPERPVPCFKEFRNGAVLAREERQCVYTAEDCTKLGGTPSASGLETTDACLDRCDTYEAIEFSSSNNDGSSAECHEKVCVSSFTSGPYNTLKGDDCTPIEPDEPDETGTGGTGGTDPGTGGGTGDSSLHPSCAGFSEFCRQTGEARGLDWLCDFQPCPTRDTLGCNPYCYDSCTEAGGLLCQPDPRDTGVTANLLYCVMPGYETKEWHVNYGNFCDINYVPVN